MLAFILFKIVKPTGIKHLCLFLSVYFNKNEFWYGRMTILMRRAQAFAYFWEFMD